MKKDSVGIVSEVRLTVDDQYGRLVIADPCYVDTDDGTTGAEVLSSRGEGRYSQWGVVLEDCAGDWVGEIDLGDEGRCSVLRLLRLRDRRKPHLPWTVDWELVGHNGVDSGQMYAAGVEHLPVDYDALIEQYRDGSGTWIDLECLAFGGGIVCHTGYGDGTYPVYVYRETTGQVVAVEVRFMEWPEGGDEY